MTLQEMEDIFNRALRFCFCKKKFCFVFPVLLVCGVLIIFCRAISLDASPWVVMSLSFMPVFLCTGILLAAGVLLIRIYYHEVKGTEVKLQKLLTHSIQSLIGASYLALPLILGYLLLWALMGVFLILKGIPGIGDGIAVLLSFGPFILVCGSLLLSFASLLILFFVTPYVALRNGVHLNMAEDLIERMQKSVFLNGLLLLVGITPLLFCIGFLTFAALLTGSQYLTATAALGVSMEWFFIMIPFAFILTPFVIFFFHFAMESYGILHKRNKAAEPTIKVDKAEDEFCAAQL